MAGAVLLALGNMQSKSAIPILIERAAGQQGSASNDVCSALITLQVTPGDGSRYCLEWPGRLWSYSSDVSRRPRRDRERTRC
jgi:hypothetical protein